MKLGVYAFIGFLLAASVAQADRVYQFVDYPDLQNGYTVAGTITTTDTAPDDSRLSEEEILDWQWSITGPNNFQRSFHPDGFINALNVTVSPEHIGLPLHSTSSFSLSAPPNVVGSSRPNVFLHWLTFLCSESEDSCISRYTFGFSGRDAVIPYWRSDIPHETSTWTIAMAVPEPSSLLTVVILLLGFCACRRRGS